MWNFDYKAHRLLTAPAQAKSELWRFAAGILTGTGVVMFLYGLFYTAVFAVCDAMNITVDNTGNTASSAVILLLGFAMFSISIFLVVLTLHRRPIRTIFGPARLAVPQFVRVCIAMILLLIVVFVLPPWGYGDPLIANMEFGTWVAILPITLFAVFIQTSAEEILFRGYMQQQLAARFASPIVWMVVPSAIFAMLHYDPGTTGENAVIMVIWAFVFGMMMADLTARSGSLGPAMAVHFINNVSALLIVSIPGQLDGVALYVLPFGFDDTAQMRAWMPVDFVLICISWLVARLAIRA